LTPITNLPVKLFEVRDSRTFIPVIAVRLLALPFASGEEQEIYLLRRAGYSQESIVNPFELPNIFVGRLQGGTATYDPYEWDNRTLTTAHQHMIDHWEELVSGQVIDVEFILGETKSPKTTERLRER
jgi:hypothetical protein